MKEPLREGFMPGWAGVSIMANEVEEEGGWTWLLRQREDGLYFANIIKNDQLAIAGTKTAITPTGIRPWTSCENVGRSPAEAFFGAYRKWKKGK